MLMLPQAQNGLSLGNDAVRLWDGSNVNNRTSLFTNNLVADQTVLAFTGLLSFWLRQTQGTFRITTQQNPSDERGMIFQFSGNNGFFSANDVGGNVLLQAFPNGLPNYGTDWKHYLISYDYSAISTASLKICVDDTPNFSTTNTHGGLALFQRTTFDINYQGTSPAELFDFWHISGNYDAYDVATRRKFINADRTPVALGSRGRLPYGTSPRLFFSGNVNGWRRNKGSLALNELTLSNPANFGKALNSPLL